MLCQRRRTGSKSLARGGSQRCRLLLQSCSGVNRHKHRHARRRASSGRSLPRGDRRSIGSSVPRAPKRPARRRRADRNRRRRRIKKGKATIPKPRFSPKMKHDSCIPSTKSLYEWQQVSGPCTRLLQQIERSASQAVSTSRDSKLHLSSLRVRR